MTPLLFPASVKAVVVKAEKKCRVALSQPNISPLLFLRLRFEHLALNAGIVEDYLRGQTVGLEIERLAAL